MRKYINLTIGGVLCDLPPDGFNFEINKRASKGFQPASGNLERSISLPVTKNNDLAFTRWWLAMENAATGTVLMPSTLIANGLILMDGKAQLNSADLRSGAYAAKGKGYNTSLFDGNGDWLTQIGDMLLSALDWSGEVHDFTEAAINSGFTASYGGGDKYGYFPAKITSHGIIPPTLLNAGTKGFYPFESRAFIFIRTFLDKIYSYFGYYYTSNFWETKKGKGLAMTILFPKYYGADFSEAYLNAKGERTTTRSYIGTGLPDQLDLTAQTQTPPQGSNPLVLSAVGVFGSNTWQYTAKSTGFYRCKMRVTITNISSASVLNLGFAVTNGADAFNISPANNGDTFEVLRVIPLDFGDVLESVITFSLGDTADVTFASAEIVGQARITKDTPIDFKYLLRDWKIADFLVGLGQLFNSQWETGVGYGQIVTEPQDDYLYTEQQPDLSQINVGFLTAPTTNWAAKLDLSKPITDKFERRKNEIAFRYKADSSDPTVEKLQQDNDLDLYESLYTLPTNRFEQGRDVEENVFFAPTIHIFDNEIKAPNSLVTPQLPLFWKEDFNEDVTAEELMEDYEPRILYFAGQRGGIDGYIKYFNATTSTEIELPAAFAVNYNDTSGLDPCLSYCNQTINGIEVQGLMQRYYLKSLARIRSGRVRECYMYLNDSDIALLSFRPRIFLDGVWWVLLEVLGYNPLTPQSCKVVLYLDEAETQNDIDSITASAIEGITGEQI